MGIPALQPPLIRQNKPPAYISFSAEIVPKTTEVLLATAANVFNQGHTEIHIMLSTVMSHLMITYLTSGATFVDDPRRLVAVMPRLLMLCFVAGFVLLKIPTMIASLFSGHVGGHSSGLSGLVTAVVARAR